MAASGSVLFDNNRYASAPLYIYIYIYIYIFAAWIFLLSFDHYRELAKLKAELLEQQEKLKLQKQNFSGQNGSKSKADELRSLHSNLQVTYFPLYFIPFVYLFVVFTFYYAILIRYMFFVNAFLVNITVIYGAYIPIS